MFFHWINKNVWNDVSIWDKDETIWWWYFNSLSLRWPYILYVKVRQFVTFGEFISMIILEQLHNHLLVKTGKQWSHCLLKWLHIFILFIVSMATHHTNLSEWWSGEVFIIIYIRHNHLTLFYRHKTCSSLWIQDHVVMTAPSCGRFQPYSFRLDTNLLIFTDEHKKSINMWIITDISFE